jgi:hypothetical protein
MKRSVIFAAAMLAATTAYSGNDVKTLATTPDWTVGEVTSTDNHPMCVLAAFFGDRSKTQTGSLMVKFENRNVFIHVSKSNWHSKRRMVQMYRLA